MLQTFRFDIFHQGHRQKKVPPPGPPSHTDNRHRDWSQVVLREPSTAFFKTDAFLLNPHNEGGYSGSERGPALSPAGKQLVKSCFAPSVKAWRGTKHPVSLVCSWWEPRRHMGASYSSVRFGGAAVFLAALGHQFPVNLELDNISPRRYRNHYRHDIPASASTEHYCIKNIWAFVAGRTCVDEWHRIRFRLICILAAKSSSNI